MCIKKNNLTFTPMGRRIKRNRYALVIQFFLILFYFIGVLLFIQKWSKQYQYDFSTIEIVSYTIFNTLVLLVWPFINNFVLIKLFIKGKGKWLIVLAQIFLLYFTLYTSAWIDAVYLSKYKVEWLMSDDHVNSRFFIVLCFTGIFSMFKFMLLFFEKNDAEKELKIMQMESDLKFLRTQISPHFLQNSLNNIYSYSLQKREETPDLVLKLSNILRYVLHAESNYQYSLLVNEVKICRDYTDLFLVNKRWLSKIGFQTDSLANAGNIYIEPHILLTILENAFKYTNLDEENSFIHFKVSIKHEKIEISCSNYYSQTPINTTKIGLENLRNRLDIVYNKKHFLQITDENNIFTVNLSLPIIKND